MLLCSSQSMNKYSIKYIVLLAMILLSFIPVKAHHGGENGISGPGITGPIITIPARTIPKGIYFLGAGINYTNFDQYTNSEIIHLNKQGKHIHSPSHIFIPSLNGGYGVTDNLFFALTVPYAFKYDYKTAFRGMAIDQGNAIGIGDITLFGEYRFYKNETKDLHSALISGIKIPSGVRRVKDNQGLLFEADEQPGTGSWDPFVGLAVSKGFEHFSFDANGLYQISTEGTQNTIVGDTASFNVALSHRINSNSRFLYKYAPKHFLGKNISWDLILEANGGWTEKPEIRMRLPFGHTGIRESNHGGLLIYLTPGIRLTYDKKWITNLAISIGTIEDLNGIQRTPSFRLVFGVNRIFN